MIILVKIIECHGQRKETIIKARTDSLEEAINRAIKKGYRKCLRFVRDDSLTLAKNAFIGQQYGQLVTRLKDGSTTPITGRVAIKAEQF